jgi:hypothetical protein
MTWFYLAIGSALNFSAFTVLFGVVLLKEKEYLLRKIVAGFIAVFGVFLLV